MIDRKRKNMEDVRRKTFLKTTLTSGLLLSFIILIVLGIMVGSADLQVDEVIKILLKSLPILGENLNYQVDKFDQTIVMNIRLPRIILSFLVGSALSLSGVIFQTLFRNPMAEPFVIGTSSGAALGAALAFVLGVDYNLLSFINLNMSSVPFMAFIGALFTTLLVYNLARVGNKVPIIVLLLSGIAVSALISSITALIMILNREDFEKIILFTMGGFSANRWNDVYGIIPHVLAGAIFVLSYARDLDVMLLGEEKAYQLGVNLDRLQSIMIFSASLLVAAAVSVSGIIGFVGLVVPHIIRLIIGPEHRVLCPLSALAGGVFLLTADTIARTVFSPLELPVGIITSLMGAPFFIYLLRKKKGSLVI